jgi:hypothetical protein
LGKLTKSLFAAVTLRVADAPHLACVAEAGFWVIGERNGLQGKLILIPESRLRNKSFRLLLGASITLTQKSLRKFLK